MAASKSLKEITDNFEEELTCSVCLEIFTEPKTLPCLHSFCRKCITQWFQKGGNPFNKEIECPNCKTRVVVTDGDPSKLPSSFNLDSLLPLLHAMKSKATCQPESPHCVKCGKTQVLVAFCAQCNGMICEACFNAHKLFKELTDEHQPIMLNQFKQENVKSFIKNQMLCKFHVKKKLEFFCQTCIVCVCAILEHQNHKMQSLEDAGQDSRKLIEGAMNLVEKRKESESQLLEQSKENIQRIKREIGREASRVDDAVKRICDMAKEHGRVMKNELRQTLQELKTANDEEQAAIKTRLGESEEFVQHCQALLDRDVAYEEIESKQMILERAKMLSQAPSVLRDQSIKRDVKICYSVTEQVMQSLQDIGRIVKNVTDPAQSTIEFLKTLHGFLQECKIITKNTEGDVFPTRIEAIDVSIKDMEGKEVEKEMSKEQAGIYKVTFEPQAKKLSGPYEIRVKIGGEDINNSPQKVELLPVKELFKPLENLGEGGSGKGQLNAPMSIAVSNNGDIAIADFGNQRVQIFSHDGKYIRHLGKEGKGGGQLYYPFGVVFNEDRIFVSDGRNGKGTIQEFHVNGTCVRTVYKAEHWFEPRGMCVNDDNHIAVCCWGNQKKGIKPSIKVFNKQGNLLQEFHICDNKGQPFNITYGNGKYFVSFPSNNCVRVFDVNGELLYTFGQWGGQDGQFNVVRGLSVYGPDMILVCDVDNHRVQLFTQEGQFIRSFGSRGSDVGQMKGPVDVLVAADGRVYVLEYTGNRVSGVKRYQQLPPFPLGTVQ